MTIGPFATPDDVADRDSDRWTVADLIDLEFFLSADDGARHAGATTPEALSDRDRAIYLNDIAPTLTAVAPHTREHRRLSLRRWLSARRAAETPERRLVPPGVLPGHAFTQALRITGWGLALLGFMLGIGAASALLSYDGARPINIAWYLFLLVFVQFLVIGGATAAWLVRRLRPVERAVQDLSLLGRLVRPLVTRISDALLRHRAGTARQEVGDQTATQVGRLRAQYALYGPVSFLPMLIPGQVFGVAFNLGVIVTTIALEWFTDLAFGWGTALDLSPAFVHDLARVLAWPWAWLFGEGIGYPTLDQVAGSRIVLKDPLFLLDAGHLRSWRWFLVLAVFSYALLPRLLLLGASRLTQQRLLERLPFTQARTQALYARLLAPKVETAAHGGGHGPEMPIPAPVVHQGPLAWPSAGPAATDPDGTVPPPAAPDTTATSAPAPDELPPPIVSPPGLDTTPGAAPLGEPAHRQEPEPPIEGGGESGAETEVGVEVGPEPTAAMAPALEPAPSAAIAPIPEPEPAPASGPGPAEPIPAPADDRPRGRPVARGIASDSCLTLIHLDVDDLIDESSRTRIPTLVQRFTGWRIAASASFGSGSAMTAGVIDWVSGQRWEDPPGRVAVIMDGSQPPITETLRFLRELRAAAGAQAAVALVLVGDPQEDDPLPPVRAFDFVDWQRKIGQLGDPYLRLVALTGGRPDGGA